MKMVTDTYDVLALKCDIKQGKWKIWSVYGRVSCYGIKTSLCYWTRTIKRAETMGLLTILKKMKQKEKEMRILMLGLDNAGKTTILKKFNGEDINTIEPTLGFNIKTLEHREFKLNIWDVGGQKSLRSYWRNYFESTDGLVWVVDSADRRRLADCKEELKGLLLEERLAGATLLVFANKQDLPGALSAEEIKDALDLEAIKTHHWNIQWCSAVTGEKLLDGIDWIISDIASRIFTMD